MSLNRSNHEKKYLLNSSTANILHMQQYYQMNSLKPNYLQFLNDDVMNNLWLKAWNLGNKHVRALAITNKSNYESFQKSKINALQLLDPRINYLQGQLMNITSKYTLDAYCFKIEPRSASWGDFLGWGAMACVFIPLCSYLTVCCAVDFPRPQTNSWTCGNVTTYIAGLTFFGGYDAAVMVGTALNCPSFTLGLARDFEQKNLNQEKSDLIQKKENLESELKMNY